jgi:hypothetical protein
MKPDQHALTPERWSTLSLDQQILMIANEMHRASDLFAPEDRERLLGSYERVVRLTELTIMAHSKPTLRRELMLWRGVIADLYASDAPSPTTHRRAFSVLLQFTPAAYAQTPHLGL